MPTEDHPSDPALWNRAGKSGGKNIYCTRPWIQWSGNSLSYVASREAPGLLVPSQAILLTSSEATQSVHGRCLTHAFGGGLGRPTGRSNLSFFPQHVAGVLLGWFFYVKMFKHPTGRIQPSADAGEWSIVVLLNSEEERVPFGDVILVLQQSRVQVPTWPLYVHQVTLGQSLSLGLRSLARVVVRLKKGTVHLGGKRGIDSLLIIWIFLPQDYWQSQQFQLSFHSLRTRVLYC